MSGRILPPMVASFWRMIMRLMKMSSGWLRKKKSGGEVARQLRQRRKSRTPTPSLAPA